MPIAGAAISAGTALYGAHQQRRAGESAARAGQQGAAAEMAQRQKMYDESSANFQPYMQSGVDGLARQSAFLNGDRSGFENDAGYKFMRDQQQQGLERGAAARGRLYSGGTSVDLVSQMTGLANQHAGDYWNRISQTANQGQNAASGLAQLGANMATGNAQSINGATQARQSGYLNTGAANAGAAGAVGGAFNNWYQNNSARNGGGSGFYFGNTPGKG